MNWLDRDTVRAPHLILCISEKEFLDVAEHCELKHPGRWMDEDCQMAVCHTWRQQAKLICVICLHPDAFNAADPIQVAAALVHEAVHVFQRLCDSIGEDNPSDEFEAYSIERIAERLMREYVRRMTEK